ncbi:MAG TPA: endopeptidase La [Candidatus Hydrogenedentes bacterium]|nr:endopeptidase La [Candidatus Hydrogenedentota bacterium]
MPTEFVEDDILTGRLPLLPLRDMVLFPRMIVPLLVGRTASITAVEESLASNRPLFLCAQRDATVETPQRNDLYSVGIAANILQTLRIPDGTMKVVVEGIGRGKVLRLYEDEVMEVAVCRLDDETPPTTKETLALMRAALEQFEEYAKLSQRVAPEIVLSMRSESEPGALADLICAYLSVRFEERQELLEVQDAVVRLEKLSAILVRENELLEIEQTVRERVRDHVERNQREFYLQEQLKVIHQELGGREDEVDEFTELRRLIKKAKMPKEANEKALRELGRYERMPAMSPESTVIRTFVDWLTDMPWQKRTADALDIARAQKVLDEDHYGLAKVKERILEFLAVRKLSKSARGPVLCLVGPPGVGKTSLGRSIARAMKRKFVRVSLGGVRDEAEIRGHRRTYIGAMPGRIIQSIKKVGVRNPVFMLDEVDKMSTDFRGDPSSALLEVLDPEQNRAFSDHYLEVDFDLHEVFFITTANNEFQIPPALHDRMEVVRLPGYTVYEKERIGRLFLIPKQVGLAGLNDDVIRITDGAVDKIISRYTREAGVRQLERQIASVCRKVAKRIVSKKGARRVVVNEKRVVELLGPEEFSELRAEVEPQAGVAVGLAWTETGGDILNIESTTMKGKGELTLTGQLGDVMKESAHAALTYLRAHAAKLRLSPDFYKDIDIHVHVPEGAIPKDGPSAGVAIAVSILSALRDKPPKTAAAMTGEITLRGRVLPVGGVKEKVLAAHRAGIRTILMPKENEKDLIEIPKSVRNDIEFVLVSGIDEVISRVFGTVRKSARKP